MAVFFGSIAKCIKGIMHLLLSLIVCWTLKIDHKCYREWICKTQYPGTPSLCWSMILKVQEEVIWKRFLEPPGCSTVLNITIWSIREIAMRETMIEYTWADWKLQMRQTAIGGLWIEEEIRDSLLVMWIAWPIHICECNSQAIASVVSMNCHPKKQKAKSKSQSCWLVLGQLSLKIFQSIDYFWA